MHNVKKMAKYGKNMLKVEKICLKVRKCNHNYSMQYGLNLNF